MESATAQAAGATAQAARPARSALTRDQLAELVLPLLTEEPQSAAALGRTLGRPTQSRDGGRAKLDTALAVLESRRQAKRVGRGQWVRGDATLDAPIKPDPGYEWPFTPAQLPLDQMFVDQDYQRPLTDFVEQIQRGFDPLLFGVLALSDRGKGRKHRYALMDGQTRWMAATRLGVIEAPTIVYTGLTVAQEADIFARLQQNRRGIGPYFRFRANLIAGLEEAQAIDRLVSQCGYKLGVATGEIRYVAAIERCYRINGFLLERTLVAFRDAFPDERKKDGEVIKVIPSAAHVRGMHYWMRDRRHEFRKPSTDFDDSRLVRRLQTAGLAQLARRASAAREFSGLHTSEVAMAQAIQAIYQSGSR